MKTPKPSRRVLCVVGASRASARRCSHAANDKPPRRAKGKGAIFGNGQRHELPAPYHEAAQHSTTTVYVLLCTLSRHRFHRQYPEVPDMSEPVEEGYILLARRLFKPDSQMMSKPPLHFKLWSWMIERAEWRGGGRLRRGQFHTSIAEMQNAMSYYKGFIKKTPSPDQIRSAYEAFVEAMMITTTKATRGMVVTILNYNRYQNPENYVAHSEARYGRAAKPAVSPQDSKEVKEGRKKKEEVSCRENEKEKGTYEVMMGGGGAPALGSPPPRSDSPAPEWPPLTAGVRDPEEYPFFDF